MSVDLNYCKNTLKNGLDANPSLLKQTSSIYTREIWGDNKFACINKFDNLGGMKGIERFVGSLNIESENYHGSAEEDKNTFKQDTKNRDNYIENPDKKIVTEKGEQSKIFADISGVFNTGLERLGIIALSIIGIVAIVIIFKMIKYLFAFVYDVLYSSRFVFLKVSLPRGDSKSDREREKELAKDMKEKIGRMAQVYRNVHKLGSLSVRDNIMKWIFSKAKISIILHYEDGLVNFLIGSYPEYISILEGAIAAQYSEATIETVKPPKFYSKKYFEVIPLQPTKQCIYPIRTFKQLEDDPMNNVVDAIGKISNEDTFSIMITMRPETEKFNKKAQKYADALYKKDEEVINRKPLRKYILFPRNIVSFLISGPSTRLIEKFGSHPGANKGDPFIRMVKAEEEALNTMGEEAGKPAFHSGLLMCTSSDDENRTDENVRNVTSAFSVYKDEYNNELDQPEFIADLLGFIVKPLWKFASIFYLPVFCFKRNVFTVNELASLFHFPDGTYNRSPIIKWMDYKVLPAPDNIPKLKEENGFFLTGKVAEGFKGGDISKIFKGSKNRDIGDVSYKEEILDPIGTFTEAELVDKDIIERDGKKFVRTYKEKNIGKGVKLYKDGVLLGLNVYRNKFIPVYMTRKDRSRHHYIIGKSGGGKSVYISSLARQDVWNGDGLCVIDPHGDLVEDILNYVPKERAKDVIYFDAGNEERPMGLNLYEITNYNEADRVVNDATEIFLKMFGPEIFGPRIQEYFKYGSLTLLADLEEGATLLDVPRLFTDEVFREYKVKKVKEPYVRNFWEKTYNAMGDREKQEIIPYFTSKFVSFTTNSLIRNIIGQTKSAFRFRETMDSGKILLINLSKGKIGELNAQLLGMIIVAQLYNAAMSRADIPEDQRRDFFLYVDEFQNFVSGTFADILSEARKYHLALIMAHQYIAQLEGGGGNNIGESGGGKNSVKDAVFGNVGTMQSFKVGAPDAEFLEKEYAPTLTQQDIIGISNYKVYIKLNIKNATSRVFSMDTIWTEDYKNDKIAGILKEYCSKKYGRKKEFVNAEISARLGMLDEDDIEKSNESGSNNKSSQEKSKISEKQLEKK